MSLEPNQILVFTNQEILNGYNCVNMSLIANGLEPLTLDQYKETLIYPITDEILPRYPVKK